MYSGIIFVSKFKTSEKLKTTGTPAVKKGSGFDFWSVFFVKEEEIMHKKEEHMEEKADTVTHEEKVKPWWFLLLDKLFYFSVCSRGVNVSYSGDIFLKEMFSPSSHIHEA